MVNVCTADLVDELKLLRRGRGIFEVRLAHHVGPALRAVCEILPEDDTVEIRRKVSERLRALIAPLPADLGTVLLAAFGIPEQARQRFYGERVDWAAELLDRGGRTVRRRIDEGISQLAELAVAAEEQRAADAYPSPDWHTEDLRVALALDQPVAEAFEVRRVIADADGIDELDLALTLTAADGPGRVARDSDLQVDVFYGGSLASRRMESRDRVGLALRLPSPLRRSERHEIALRFRAGLRYPHYVCVPRHPCDLFDLHVRFARPPAEIIRLDKAFQDDARDSSARGTLLEVDDAGEIHEQFRQLVPGFAYGVRWQPADPD